MRFGSPLFFRMITSTARSSMTRRVVLFIALLGATGAGLAQSPWLVPYGNASCGSDYVPTWHTAGEMPVIGNANFKMVSENLIGSAPGFLLISEKSASLALLPGMIFYIDPAYLVGIGCQATGAVGVAGNGALTLSLPIPNSPFLVGGNLFAQGIFLDLSLPSTLVHTHGLGITIAQSIAVEQAVIRDRLKYQAHFSGATPAQADTLGAAIWAANQVAGYSYVKTEQYTCGGQSHWMVIVRHAQTGMEFCLIPGGTFRMGDLNGTSTLSAGRYETPLRWVHIKPFLHSRTLVTQSVWLAVMGFNPSNFQGPTLPVERVSWNDTQAFCARTGLRLPTEAEWEYACRAGVTNCYHFGVNYVAPGPANLGLYAWYTGNSGGTTHPVGTKLPNAFGLYDKYGNLWEWCQDLWSKTEDYKCAPTDGRPVLDGHSANIRVIHGGSWRHEAHICRSSIRDALSPTFSGFGLGFRVSGPSLP